MIQFIVAILAPIISSIRLLPQFYKTYRRNSVKDLSLYSLLLMLISSLLWLLHGYFIIDISLIIANIVAIIINVALLILYFSF